MKTFYNWLEWLIAEARQPRISPAVLAGYEQAFKDSVRKLIQRTENPDLRAKFIEMLDCPIRDNRGGCRSFSDYIYSALLRHGIHHQYDIEEALHYVFEKMMMPTTDAGDPRATVFGGFVEKPEYTGGNPLQARFMKHLKWVINGIRGGKIPRLALAAQRPPGTVSISQGRQQDGDPAGGISADEIAARPSADADLGEMVGDIMTLLRRKEPAYGFPLVSLFQSIMAGMSVEEQRKRFGDRKVRTARLVIVDTVGEYARSTGNRRLLNLLQRLRDRPEEAAPARSTPVKAPKPVVSDQERDYASIASVIARFERPVGTADLGKYRRRWLEYPPRTPGSGHRNRLEEVLEAMVRDGVLRATQTRNGATVYQPGPRFEEFHRQEVEA
jgi:hypothetical protein